MASPGTLSYRCSQYGKASCITGAGGVLNGFMKTKGWLDQLKIPHAWPMPADGRQVPSAS